MYVFSMNKVKEKIENYLKETIKTANQSVKMREC